MNGYQRINAVLQGEWPDIRPVMLHNFMPAAREAGLTQQEYRDSAENIAKTHIQAAEKYDLDGVFIDVDTATTAAAVGVPTDYPKDEPARCHEGALPDLEGLDDLPAPDLANNERVQIWVEACRLVKQHFGDEKFVRGNCDQLPFSLASMLRTPQDWMMDLIDPSKEEQVFALLDYGFTACKQFVELMVETGVDMISHGDSPSGPEMISPSMYNKYALPYQKQMAEFVQSKNARYLLHICGKTEPILEAMLETGADAFDIDYKTDVTAIYNTMGDKATLSGNLDPSGVLTLGTPELVAETTRELLDVYKDSPRLIVCSGCALPNTAPEANLRAMIDVVREG